ncbi:endo alpha-1,4 polygalactosaminidase [Actinoplanes sp. G11-F43]|uniref:endo alpha-1,4 polygalactosaminidase n=1 Tax=Actinoplanes sp. G11-F43 TaxID=3424130 RepID=UPI003D33269D
MAVDRERVKVGAVMAGVVVVALGVGIGTADAGTRRSWWGPAGTAPVAAPNVNVSPSRSPNSSPAASRASVVPEATATKAGWTRPPAGAGVDYQLGGAYPLPKGVTVVSRDREAKPAAGAYNICYVNAFQAQPGDEAWWTKNHPDLLLKDRNGDLVIDEDWDELIFDISTETKRTALTAIVGKWIDGCAADGFQAIESDNLDSYLRSKGLLTQAQAVAFATALNHRAHASGLAGGQKNFAELGSANARKAGFDFAVAEECGEWDECDAYTATYGNNVIVIEYSRDGFAKACDAFGDRLSIVLRDVDVSAPGSRSYVYEAC